MKTYLRVLLDENLPVKLKYRLVSEELFISTVRDQNWLGKKNGELLHLMQSESFTVLISNDKHLIYQQNTSKSPIIILKINALSNRYEDLLSFVPAIKDELMNIKNDFENGVKSSFLEMRILK